jgi:tetratricopeptide (TPR) repeat protein
LLQDIARSHGKLKKYDQSIYFYDLYIRKKPSPLSSDFFLLGKALYNAGNYIPVNTADSAMKNIYLQRADSIFNNIIQLSSGSYLGYFWNARVKSLLDPESIIGLAKPYYEKAIEIMSASPDKYVKELIEAYSYLGYYYYLNNDMVRSKQYWEKILILDPMHEKAQQAIKEIK